MSFGRSGLKTFRSTSPPRQTATLRSTSPRSATVAEREKARCAVAHTGHEPLCSSPCLSGLGARRSSASQNLSVFASLPLARPRNVELAADTTNVGTGSEESEYIIC